VRSCSELQVRGVKELRRIVARTSGMLVTAIVTAYIVARSPAVAFVSDIDVLSWSRTPVGIISALTVVKVAPLNASSDQTRRLDSVTPRTLTLTSRSRSRRCGWRRSG